MAVLAAAVTAAGAQGAVPSDPLATSWTYAAAGLPAAWDLTTGSPAVVIAVVDSGVDATHPDLAGAVDPGYDFVDRDSDATDDQGHGTAVAGIAAARANNGVGAAGACWSCRILPLRVLGPDGFAPNARTAEAIDFAVAHGAAVVNVSLYGENLNARLEDAVRRARAAGVVVVAAAGNEGGQIREYPAAYPSVLSVGATTETGALTSYSSRGNWVKLAAPACMPTTQLGGGFGAGCGTSGATPLVAGVAALLRSQAPFASVGEIEAALALTAAPLAGVRFGRVDAFAALRRLGRPSPRLLPTIRGYGYVGETLTAYSGVWAGAPLELGYRWVRCRTATCARVTTVGESRTYRIRSGDRRHLVRVVITANGDAGTIVATSRPTLPVR
jgi:subtilisin family serine protease